MDIASPALDSLTLGGTLKAMSGVPFELTAGYVFGESTGRLEVGREGAPWTLAGTITLTGLEASRAARFVPDVTASSGTGNGTLKSLASSTGAVAETITVTWSSATAFSVSGSVSGSLGSGTVGTLFNNRVRFTATAGGTAWAASATRTISVVTRGFTNSGLPRSIQWDDGFQLSLVGNPPAVTRTRLNDHLDITDNTLTLADSVSWASGDQIVVGPSDFTDTTSGVAEEFTLASPASGTTAAVTVAATRYKWGKLQYPTDAGMSLTAGTLTNNGGSDSTEWAAIPKVLDERAAVINLTRNIVIQGANDSEWSTNRFGAHIMGMGLNSRMHIDGVQFKRMGQAGAIGRYPVHLHMLSYSQPDGMNLPSNGTFLGATTNANHYVKNSSIHGSSQRALVTHGTHGALFHNNVMFDITGHAVFLEDGAEELNTVSNNTVIKVSAPTSANRLIDSELSAPGGGAAGVTCYWMSNPNNNITGNWGFGAVVGMWNVFAANQAFGLSQNVAVVPRTRPVLDHSGNVMGCNSRRGLMTEFPPTDNRGSAETPTFFAGFLSAGQRFTFTGNVSYKNIEGGYLNRVNSPGLYTGWTVADNAQLDFSGQADHDVTLNRSLCVGVSLNNANAAETRADDTRRGCFTSYDEGFVVKDVIGVNYPYREPPSFSRSSFGGAMSSVQGGGFVRMGEYIFPVWTFTEYRNWKLVGSSPGFMCTPPHIDGGGAPGNNQKFTLGILRDVTGVFTGTANKSVVWNDTFYTDSAASVTNWGDGARAKQTTSLYMGLNHGVVSGIDVADPYAVQAQMYTDKLDSGGTIVGSWNVPDSRTGGFGLSHFKHCGLMRGGIYRTHFNGELPSGSPVFVVFGIQMMTAAADTCVLGVAWPNGTTVGTVYLRWRTDRVTSDLTAFELANTAGTPPLPYAIKFNNTSMTSKADVVADTTGLKYWQDTTNNVVWIRLKGGLVYDELATYPSSGLLNPNREMGLAIRSQVLP